MGTARIFFPLYPPFRTRTMRRAHFSFSGGRRRAIISVWFGFCARFCGARGLAGEIGRLLPGTDWQAFSWEAFLPACRAVAACAGAAAAFLDPEEIVLCGEALGPAHLEQVRRQCAKMLAGPPPRFTLAENFLEDYTAGVASQTLEALECALETEL